MFIKYKIFGKAEIAIRQVHKKIGVIIWLVWMDIPLFFFYLFLFKILFTLYREQSFFKKVFLGGQNLIFQVNKENFILCNLKYDRWHKGFFLHSFLQCSYLERLYNRVLTRGLYLFHHFAQASHLLGQPDLIVPQFLQVLSFLHFQQLQLQLLLLLQELVHFCIFWQDNLLTGLCLFLTSHQHAHTRAHPHTHTHTDNKVSHRIT